jgi:hypothetical protein
MPMDNNHIFTRYQLNGKGVFLLINDQQKRMLVVKPDYLPDSKVFYFQPCLYPMKYLHPRSMYTL